MNTKTRVLIADDHSLVRQGLQTFLGLDPEIEVVGTATNGLETLEAAERLQPDVLLLDLMMPKVDGFEVLARLPQSAPTTRVLVLTSALETDTISRAIEAGANGYLLKNMQAQELCRNIKAIGHQSFAISTEAAQLLTAALNSSTAEPATTQNLSEREKEVLKMIAMGKANKEIAYSLKLSEGTVKTHVSILLAKLKVQTRTQAAIYANQAGLGAASETE